MRQPTEEEKDRLRPLIDEANRRINLANAARAEVESAVARLRVECDAHPDDDFNIMELEWKK